MTKPPDPPAVESALPAIVAAVAAALVLALIAFMVVDSRAASGASGAVTLTFLIVVPAALCALASLISDPQGDRPISHYAMVPLIFVGIVAVAGYVLLREGVICILMLAPLWVVAGMTGSLAAYLVRKRFGGDGRVHSSAALLLPLLAVQVESASPPVAWRIVGRETLIEAPPERVWPLLASIRAIGPGEGRWNLAQDVLGIPRPVEAILHAEGEARVRRARWESGVRFEEEIVAERPGRSIEWRFRFPDDSVRRHTDRHIAPDGAHLMIATGAYRLEPAPGGRSRLRLETRYALRSPLNDYAAWWGELLLGGIQANVLGIVRDRAESAERPRGEAGP